MYLFLNLGQIALTNQMIVQGEAFLKAAISLIPKLPITFSTTASNAVQSTSSLLAEYVHNFCSLLLLLPGHPQKGAFYLVEELTDALTTWTPWDKDHQSVDKIRALLAIFRLFTTLSQQTFPYQIDGVSSNDRLYAQAPKYIKALNARLNQLGMEIHSQIILLSRTGKHLVLSCVLVSCVLSLLCFALLNLRVDVLMCSSQDKTASGTVSLEFINVLLDFVTFDQKVIQIIVELHKGALKVPNLDKKFLNNTMQHVRAANEMLFRTLQSQEERGE